MSFDFLECFPFFFFFRGGGGNRLLILGTGKYGIKLSVDAAGQQLISSRTTSSDSAKEG